MPKSALITGASDRIGKRYALSLAEKGYDIFLHFNTSEYKAKETAEIIGDKGVSCTLVQADFHKEEEVEDLVEQCIENGPINLLINNASRYVKSDIDTEGTELFYELMKSNFVAPYILTKHYARFHDKGQIINILDTKISQSNNEYMDYTLTKKLLREFTMMTAVQLAPDIRVNGIAPGIILPPPGKSEAYTEYLAQKIPMKHGGNPQELIKALDFFINSEFTTGEIIFVDGGENL